MNREAFERHLIWAEDRRRFPYVDSVGKTSIGVGRNLTDRGLSGDEIDYLLSNDVHAALQDAMRLDYWPELNEARQLVVADLVFNLGLTKWLGFVKANAALEAGDWERAADEMQDSLWFRQVGRRAVRLCKAMRTGEWPH